MLARSYPVEYRRGVHLPLAGLWLDPREPRDLAVVSHAHGDHIARHRAVVCTEPTYRLIVHRLGGVEPHVLRFGEERAVGAAGCTVSLHPAGHVLGAAQVLVHHEGLRVLYSGDIRVRPSRTCAPLEHVRADVLVVETTFGHQRYRFPPADEVVERVVEFCRSALAAGEVPVLLAYSLGKAQELLFQLRDSGLPVLLHPAVHAVALIYRGLGVDLPAASRLDDEDELDLFSPPPGSGESPRLVHRVRRDAVVVVPPHLRDARCVRRLAPVRRAALTGWAIDAGTVDRLECDAAFPLSDHADFDDLVSYTLATGARRVYTIHGFAQDFARHLRSRGVEASALRDAEQLPLLLA